MPELKPATDDYAQRTRDSFDRQAIMRLLGAELTRVEPGLVEIELAYKPELVQQHGFFHGGATAAIADSAGGYAAFTLFPADASVLTAEYKISFLAAAAGARLRARGSVVKPGRTLTTCDLEVLAVQADGAEKLVAKGLQTLAVVCGRGDIAEAG